MLRIIIQKFDALGKRVADAVAADSNMEVAGIIDSDPARIARAERLGYVAYSPDATLPDADALLAAPGMGTPQGLRVVSRPGSRQPLVASPEFVTPPSADAIVLMRLLEAMGGAGAWRRLDCTSAGCHEEAVRPGGIPDRLEPIFSPAPRNFARSIGLPRSRFLLSRVHVPCSASRLYFVHLEAHQAADPDSLLAGLASSPRCLLERASDGFPDTASITEYFRDSGRRRGDHHEVFIWRESVTTDGCHVYLLAEAEPVAVVVPEILDALRAMTTTGEPADYAKGGLP